jgi:hypothetical protein
VDEMSPRSPSSSITPDPTKVGPLFSPADNQRAVEALDVTLQDYTWRSGENRFSVPNVFQVLQNKGLTLALIRDMFQRLITEKVFEFKSITIPPGTYREPGHPLPVLRTYSETNEYFITTKERWYGYLNLRKAQVELQRLKEQEASLSKRMASESTPLSIVSPASTEKTEATLFDDFSPKRLQLLQILKGRQAVPISDVTKAIYGSKPVDRRALEQLVTRTNRVLASKSPPLEIKRQANTLRLQPLS